MKEIRNGLYLDIHYQFFILLIYRLLNRMKISDEGFFYTCMYSIVFKKEKMTVELNHFFFLKWRKMPRKHGMHLYRRVNLASPFLMNLKDHVNCFCSSVFLCFSSWLCSRDILKDILKYNKDTEVGWATRKQ